MQRIEVEQVAPSRVAAAASQAAFGVGMAHLSMGSWLTALGYTLLTLA
jgi:hypothetical protein